MIKEDLHLVSLSGFKAALGMFEYSFHLRTLNAGKPLKEFVYGGAAFKVLKQRFHRHTSAAKQPCPAYLSGNALDGGTL